MALLKLSIVIFVLWAIRRSRERMTFVPLSSVASELLRFSLLRPTLASGCNALHCQLERNDCCLVIGTRIRARP